MTKLELQQKLALIERVFNSRKKEAIIEYCLSNNPYKAGDVFTDHIGSIKIESISYDYGRCGDPCCVYFGADLKKDGTPFKNNTKRQAWQSNEIKTT